MNISLTPAGDFLLTLPSTLTVEIPNSPHACGLLYRVLYDAASTSRPPVASSFPSQKVIAQWQREAERNTQALAAQTHAELLASYGIGEV